MSISEFRGPGLTEAQWLHIKALVTSLDAKQLSWVSGFMAGVEYGKAPGEFSVDAGARALPAAADKPASGGARKLTVLYGSETGNSAALACTLAAEASARGLQASAHDMADYKLRLLKDEQDVAIIASTYGEGDPPQPAVAFFEFVEGRKAPKLPQLRFAVLALGDSTYERFCEAGKRLDRRFEELGAQRLKVRVDCDVDYEEAAAAWIADIQSELVGAPLSADGFAATDASASSAPSAQAQATDKRHPFPARVLDNIVLTGRGSSKETRHVELSLEGADLSFEPGDALGIVPRNDPALVERLLGLLGVAPSAPVAVKGEPLALADALTSRFEITALTPRFLDHWAALSESRDLRELARDDHADARVAFARSHHVIDVIRKFPVKGLDAARLVAALRPLQPRLYSIASSSKAAPDEVHLTVSTVRYTLHGEPREGVASGQLAHRLELDDTLPVYVQSAPHFRLPADDVPIVMVGAGTGVAPYRAFLQEREVRGATGPSWLFFGERNFRSDFLYQTEWQAWLKDGVLRRMDVAFSRDAGAKVYVQHRLLEHAREVYAWLEEGAHLYVCGDANHLAPDVHQSLADIVMRQGGRGEDGAHEYLQRLQREHRYQRDVY
ncbi:MAG: putative sulfite reductase flavoprotein alpha-component [Rhizobacter sp.]|nr:putative sulfite reductase flavoprotein alpha-component [Rhizobacter sp.]